MAITGYKTGSVFDHYNIVTEDDPRHAMTGLADQVETLPTKSNVSKMKTAKDESK